MSCENKGILDSYLDAVQRVVDRHDILRTAIMWENLTTPAQVVLCQAKLSITELSLDPKDEAIGDQLMKIADPRQHRIDLTKAPLIRFMIAQDSDGSWSVVQLLHHIIGDNSTMAVMMSEIQALLNNQAQSLQEPQPFRNMIAQARSGPTIEVHEQFFKKMLVEIDTPAFPYGLSDVHQEGLDVSESHVILPQDLNDRLRGHAKRMGVSLASMYHVAWAQVISKTSGQERVVFGTVLLGRMQGGSGSDQAMGLFINTLPIRIDVRESPVEEIVRQTQADIAALLEHEHASLALAQRCSSIPPGTPLFSAILNCRHHTSQSTKTSGVAGITYVDEHQRTNYPFTMSVDDFGSDIGLTSQVLSSVESSRICEYMQQSLQSLVDALESSPIMHIRDLEVLPVTEREMLLRSWNTTTESRPEQLCIHHLFENKVEQSQDAIAVV
ncbi:hypothetical protein BGX26_007206, partial [Mortierella sp. AD094]